MNTLSVPATHHTTQDPQQWDSPGSADQAIASPLHAKAWQRALTKHPDQEWVRAILQGMQHSSWISLQLAPQCRTATSNTPSAWANVKVVDQFIHGQISQGYMAGPFPLHACSNLITSSITVFPKKTLGKWCIIVNLLSPKDASINDSIHRQYTHFIYSSIDDAAHVMHHLGKIPLWPRLT